MEGDIDDWPNEVLFEDRPLEFGANHVSAEQCDTRGANEASVETQSHDSRIGQVLEAKYSKESICIAMFLTTLQKPAGMNSKEYHNFKKKALHYTVLNH